MNIEEMRHRFVTDIVENPTDDAPRLIYSDWCEEQGEVDRAEFIRLQIEMARGRSTLMCQRCRDYEGRNRSSGVTTRSSACTCSPRWREMSRRTDHLLHQHEGGWRVRYCPACAVKLVAEIHDESVYDIDSKEGRYAFGIHWTRGFPSHVYCAWQDWKRLGGSLVRDLPIEFVAVKEIDIRWRTVRLADSTLQEMPVIRYKTIYEVRSAPPELVEIGFVMRKMPTNRFDTNKEAYEAVSKLLIDYVRPTKPVPGVGGYTLT